MGIAFTRLFSSLFGNKEARILVLGLDNAGKTTILYRLQMGEVVSTIPTIGFNVETVHYNNIKFQVWDLGGQTSIRPYWRCYFPNTQAIIYVVDSSDTDRLVIAKEEFHAILGEEELKGAVVLIFANKQDLPDALDEAAVTEALELHNIKNRQWAIVKTSATKGEGLFEGLDWYLGHCVSYAVVAFMLLGVAVSRHLSVTNPLAARRDALKSTVIRLREGFRRKEQNSSSSSSEGCGSSVKHFALT